MRNRGVAGAYWSLVAVLVVVGVASSFLASGWASQLVYFTIQSNIYLGIIAAVTAWRLWGERRSLQAPVLTSAILFIGITGLIYNVVLAPDAVFKSDLAHFSSNVLHIVTPFAGIAGWLLFHRHGGLRPVHALIWLAYPLGYFVFVLVRGLFVASGVIYPYPFLDVDKLGYGTVLVNALTYAVVFFLLGTLFVFVDKQMAPKKGVPASQVS